MRVLCGVLGASIAATAPFLPPLPWSMWAQAVVGAAIYLFAAFIWPPPTPQAPAPQAYLTDDDRAWLRARGWNGGDRR